jgi:sortase (surface protein transpeptidase)
MVHEIERESERGRERERQRERKQRAESREQPAEREEERAERRETYLFGHALVFGDVQVHKFEVTRDVIQAETEHTWVGGGEGGDVIFSHRAYTARTK